MISYTTDFESGLVNALVKTFHIIRRIGCFFHYSTIIRKNVKERILDYINSKSNVSE